MNNLENKEILSDDILEAIDILIKVTPECVFGGSIALNAVGLLNRKISDIDIFFEIGDSLNKNGFLTIESTEFGSDTVTDTNGKAIQRTSAKIKGVKCCVFKVDKEELQHSKFSFLGRTINIQNVNYAIQAKIAYSKNTKKHSDDLNFINDILDGLCF